MPDYLLDKNIRVQVYRASTNQAFINSRWNDWDENMDGVHLFDQAIYNFKSSILKHKSQPGSFRTILCDDKCILTGKFFIW